MWPKMLEGMRNCQRLVAQTRFSLSQVLGMSELAQPGKALASELATLYLWLGISWHGSFFHYVSYSSRYYGRE